MKVKDLYPIISPFLDIQILDSKLVDRALTAVSYLAESNCEIGNYADYEVYALIPRIDEIVEKYPYPFVENLLTTFLKEFEARDKGGYSFSVDNDTEHDFAQALPEPPKPPEIDGFV